MELIHFLRRDYLRSSRGLTTKWPNDSFEGLVELGSSEISQTGSQKFELGPREILNYAWQVAKGMNYLSGMKVFFTAVSNP